MVEIIKFKGRSLDLNIGLFDYKFGFVGFRYVFLVKGFRVRGDGVMWKVVYVLLFLVWVVVFVEGFSLTFVLGSGGKFMTGFVSNRWRVLFRRDIVCLFDVV